MGQSRSTSAEDYDRIAAYAPYEQVAAKDYPPIFALAGLTDPRVTYWEPAKWVAKLRATKTDANPLYLKTNMGAGHGGASGRFDRLKETALSYAFALNVRRIGIIVPERRDCCDKPKGLYRLHQCRLGRQRTSSPTEAPSWHFELPAPALCL